MLHRVVWKTVTDVSKELAASILRVEEYPEDGRSISRKTTRRHITQDRNIDTDHPASVRLPHTVKSSAAETADLSELRAVTSISSDLYSSHLDCQHIR
jgi:hypothetical protein